MKPEARSAVRTGVLLRNKPLSDHGTPLFLKDLQINVELVTGQDTRRTPSPKWKVNGHEMGIFASRCVRSDSKGTGLENGFGRLK